MPPDGIRHLAFNETLLSASGQRGSGVSPYFWTCYGSVKSPTTPGGVFACKIMHSGT